MWDFSNLTEMCLGHYVIYKDQCYIVAKVLAESNKAVLLNPTIGNASKVTVGGNKLVSHPKQWVARFVTVRNKQYLLTNKGFIISVDTARIMQWADDHGIRKEIIDAANTSEYPYAYL